MSDDTALREQIARAIHSATERPESICRTGEADWDFLDSDAAEEYRAEADAVLPIIAAEVRKTQADAWEEGWKERAKRDVYRSHPHLDRDVPGPPRHLNPHREKED